MLDDNPIRYRALGERPDRRNRSTGRPFNYGSLPPPLDDSFGVA